MTDPLVLAIESLASDIRLGLRMSDRTFESTLNRLDSSLPVQDGKVFYDEQVWTFIVTASFAAAGDDGLRLLNHALTAGEESSILPLWFEALPMPPRQHERNTNLDLAAGFIRKRDETSAGIEYDPHDDAWVCFAEAKWYSDIDTKVSNHPERNQLARVIENALHVQGDRQFPDRVHVTLITPRRFRDRAFGTRLYRYKYEEYTQSPKTLLREFDLADETLPLRLGDGRVHPDMRARIESLRMHWTTSEELVELLPDTHIGSLVRSLSSNSGDRYSAA